MHPSVATGKKKNSMTLNLFSNLDSFVRNLTPKAGDQKSQILMSDIEVMNFNNPYLIKRETVFNGMCFQYLQWQSSLSSPCLPKIHLLYHTLTPSLNDARCDLAASVLAFASDNL